MAILQKLLYEESQSWALYEAIEAIDGAVFVALDRTPILFDAIALGGIMPDLQGLFMQQRRYLVLTRSTGVIEIYDLHGFSQLASIDLTSSGWAMILDAYYDPRLGKIAVSGFSMSPTVSGRVATIDVATASIEYDVLSGYIAGDTVIKPVTEGLSLLVKRLSANSVQCSNNTTGQVVYITPVAGEQGWNCESHGLLVAPGDSVTVSASGITD